MGLGLAGWWSSRGLSTTLMKNCAVAESGTLVRAIAMLPRRLDSPFWLSSGIGAWVGFCARSAVKPPPWTMKVGITRWKTVPS